MYDDNPPGTTPVLIVGGGLVGLSTSLFLSWQGVPHTLVERHPGTSVHPRAWGLYPRTLELLSTGGVTGDLLREAAGFAGHVLNGTVESLTGRERSVSRIPEPADVSGISPVARVLSLSQDRIEPILLRHARRLGGELRFHTELTGLTQDADGVDATLRDVASGAGERLRARYVIAADGAHSPLRERLGIARRGRGTLRHQFSIVFRADLERALRGRRFAICRIDNSEVDGVLGHDDTLRQGTLIVTHRPDRDPVEAFTTERCTALVRAAVGDPELPVTIVSALPWEMAALTAERFAEGRVLLAGDAAHVIPPVGGYGANTGIQDAHNLAWKLAQVLDGRAGPALLDTYDAERRPVARATMAQAALRLAARAGFADAGQRSALVDPLGVMFGYRYRSAAVVEEEGAPEPVAEGREFADPGSLSGAPGTRAPHLWLRRGDRRVSTVDLAGRDLLLLAGAEAGAWQAAARRAGIETLRIGEDLVELVEPEPGAGRTWYEAFGVTRAGAVLLRPDGFVGWRAPGADPSPERTLVSVRRRLLAHASL
ncbi:FAD-dependent monooxygenase [Streptomyces sp. NPDC001985]|uniref:FAD-dependent monooxygenase n=1 Tax=Streptomyces sp. NPDC001985 TaxID=3154406 RepID=UPI00332FE9DE